MYAISDSMMNETYKFLSCEENEDVTNYRKMTS